MAAGPKRRKLSPEWFATIEELRRKNDLKKQTPEYKADLVRRTEGLRALVKEYEEEFGAFTEEEMEKVRRLCRD